MGRRPVPAKPYLDVSWYYLFPDGRRFVLPLLRRLGMTGVIGDPSDECPRIVRTLVWTILRSLSAAPSGRDLGGLTAQTSTTTWSLPWSMTFAAQGSVSGHPSCRG